MPSQSRVHPLDGKFETISITTLKDIPHVTIVALNRPSKRNAMNAKMWHEIGEVFRRIGADGDGCRCVLIIGNGKAFTAGLDITDPSFQDLQTLSMSSSSTGDDDDDDGENKIDVARRGISFRYKILEMQQSLTAIEKCPIPVVAAIHGPCIGAGVDMTCCCDVRLCSPSAIFGIREVRLGLAADVGTLQRLPKIVGHGSRVRELCLTGENFNAQEAERIGYVSRISPSEDELIPMALKLCKTIVTKSPVAIYGTKLSLNYSRDHTVEDGLDHIATHNSLALMSDDLVTSFMAAASGKVPQFADIPPHSRL